MATENIVINGITYNDVPSIQVNRSGGGIAEFFPDGGGGGCNIDSVTATPSGNSTSLVFSGLKAEPKMFAVIATTQISLGSTRYIIALASDGTTIRGTYGYRSGSTATIYVSSTYYTANYQNGYITLRASSSSSGGNFRSSCTYMMIYAY